MLAIRLAEARHAAALQALDTSVPDDPRRAVDIAAWIAAGECHVAERDGVAVGYVALHRRFFHEYFVELLMVARVERRSGVGKALLQHCLAIAGGRKLFVSTNTSNLPMQGLLTSLGFVPSGRLDNLDDGDPELFFVHLP